MEAFLLALLTWLAPLSSAAQEPAAAESARPAECDITKEGLAAAWSDVAALAPELGLAPEDVPELRLVDRRELRDVLLEELLPQMRIQFPDDEATAKGQAREMATAYSRMLLAKYSWTRGEVLVCERSFERQARDLGMPELCSDEVLRALLVHELVHAADHRAHGFDATLATRADAAALLAFDAVIEGHAQLAARRICAARGWSDAFETFTRGVGGLPKAVEADPALAMMSRVVSATVRTSYVEGERFLAEVERAGGAEAVARAFREPPRDLGEVFHPEWYLDPGSRPEPVHDLEAGIDALDHPGVEGWRQTRMSVTPPQLIEAFSNLPKEEVAKLQALLRENRGLLQQPVDQPSPQMVLLLVYAFDTPEDAQVFLEASERLTRLKDELLQRGTVRVLEASYQPVEGEAAGFACAKTMSVGGGEQRLWLAVLRRGPLVAELMQIVHPTDLDALAERAQRVLAAALGEGPAKPARED